MSDYILALALIFPIILIVVSLIALAGPPNSRGPVDVNLDASPFFEEEIVLDLALSGFLVREAVRIAVDRFVEGTTRRSNLSSQVENIYTYLAYGVHRVTSATRGEVISGLEILSILGTNAFLSEIQGELNAVEKRWQSDGQIVSLIGSTMARMEKRPHIRGQAGLVKIPELDAMEDTVAMLNSIQVRRSARDELSLGKARATEEESAVVIYEIS